MRIRKVLSTALMLTFCTGAPAAAFTETERELFRPIEVKCPANNQGRFEQLARNLRGESDRIIWQFAGKKGVFLAIAVKDVTGPWDTWLNAIPGSRDYDEFMALSKIPGYLREACDDKGVRRAFAAKVRANRKLLGLAPLKQLP